MIAENHAPVAFFFFERSDEEIVGNLNFSRAKPAGIDSSV